MKDGRCDRCGADLHAQDDGNPSGLAQPELFVTFQTVDGVMLEEWVCEACMRLEAWAKS